MRKRSGTLVAALCLMAVLMMPVLPVFAETAKGEPDITAQTTMKEIRENPSIQGAGIFTYGGFDTDCTGVRPYFENDTLAVYYSNPDSAIPCAKALNLVIENYNAGIQVTHKLYTSEEIAEDPVRDKAELYYFPGKTENGRYALVLGGTAASTSGELREGLATAAELYEMGYTTFVLRYRTWVDSTDDAPMEDVARAVEFITNHAEEFKVRPEQYAIIGYSTGGHLAGLFASSTSGYGRSDLPRPAALILGYPVNDFAEFKAVYHLIMDFGTCAPRYYSKNLSDGITSDFPPTYFWYGKNDLVLMMINGAKQGPALEKALAANNVPYKKVVYKDAPHASSTGGGTDAEGWLKEGVAFWEEQITD